MSVFPSLRSGALDEHVGDGAHDEGERVRPRVGRAEALLRVRAGAAHARQQVGGGRGGRDGGVGGGRPGVGEGCPGVDLAREGRAERHERVDHRLVADLGLAVGADAVGGGRDAGGDGCRVGRVVVADRAAERAQRHAPERAGGSAGPVRPGVAGALEHRAGAGAGGDRRAGGVVGGVRAALHADAVVAVAGDRVDAAELVDVRRRWCAARRRRSPTPLGGRAGRVARVRHGDDLASASASVGGDRGAAGATEPRRKAGVSAGADQSRSSSSSTQKRVSEAPAMSKLVQNSPTCGSTTSMPASRSSSATRPKTTKSSSYFTAPRPLRIGTTRAPAAAATPSGSSSRSRATRSSARPAAVGTSVSPMPGSPWMPRPTAMRPSGTVNSGSSAPGSVQPVNATPNERVRSFASRATRTTPSRS